MNAQVSGLSDDDRRPPSNELLEIAQRGLSLKPKRLPSWLFYDERGSQLFDDICEQPEYYLTRSEIALMDEHAGSIADTLGSDVRLVEYGSGNARKTRMLLQHLHEPVAYVPVEISAEPLRLPIPPRAPRRTVLYFPGSTIGNFDNRDAAGLLRKMRNEMGDAGGILIGVDLKKDPAIIEAAYNDAAGVTAAFTLNMLTRLNRDVGSDFDLSAFRHRAHYNSMAGRIETHIVSSKAQQVKLGKASVAFREDEAIQVEYSCKYSLADFEALAAKAGLAVMRVWTDAEKMFSVQYLVRASTVAR
jgi:uncharacterized SAM-dependent methyltransferase